MRTAVDEGKRRFLIGATGVVGGVGAVAAATPFVMSFFPSERAKAAGAPVEADISKLEPGQKIDGRMARQAGLDRQPHAGDARRRCRSSTPSSPIRIPTSPQQPDYCKNEYRSIKPRCAGRRSASARTSAARRRSVPTWRRRDLGADWLGGFFCPCHGSKFDLAGRVFKGVPAPTNLEFRRTSTCRDTKIVIGDDEDGKAA